MTLLKQRTRLATKIRLREKSVESFALKKANLLNSTFFSWLQNHFFFFDEQQNLFHVGNSSCTGDSGEMEKVPHTKQTFSIVSQKKIL